MSIDELDVEDEAPDPVGMPRILLDLADGRLDAVEAEAVVDWLQAVEETEPPPWVVNRAVRIARQAEAGRPARPAAWRRLVATLVYDNRLEPRRAGARAVALDRPRLLYQAGGIEIDLEVGDSSIAGRVRMIGQVTASEPDLAQAWVAAEGPAGRTQAEVDDVGQFVLDDLPNGHHRLEIGLTYELIEIPDLQL